MDKIEEKWMQFRCPKCGCAEWVMTGKCEVISPCDSMSVKMVNGHVEAYDLTYTGYTETLYETLSDKCYICTGCSKKWKTLDDMVKDGTFVEVVED